MTLTASIPDETEPINFVVADWSWTASGGSIGPFRYCVVWNDTPTTPADPLIGYIDVGGDTTITNGNTITFDADAVNGLFTGTATWPSSRRSSGEQTARYVALAGLTFRHGDEYAAPLEVKVFTNAANAAINQA